MRRVLLTGMLAFVLHSAASAADYVGSNVCRTCHPDVWAKFYKNPHSQIQHECEGCHGPGKAHVEAHGGKATIIAFSVLPAEKTLEACLACHGESLPRANIRKSVHTQTGVICTNCHSIHKSPTPKFLLAKNQRDLCYGCHAGVRAQFDMPYKHRVNEGVMSCTDCHNPHGAFDPTWRMAARPRMVGQALENEEPCLKCHRDKRGPFAYEHAPVRVEGCEQCHFPHGSTNSRLLRRPVVFTLCLECHTGVGNFGRTNSGDPRLSRLHNLADPTFQNCTACHVRIHGSNTNAFFLR